MTCLAHRVVELLPPRWRSSIEKESRDWVVRCACGHETSIWEMGGVRFKACGNPLRGARCGKCGNVFVGQIFRRSAEIQPAGAMDDSAADSEPPSSDSQIELKTPAAMHPATTHADTTIGQALADSCLIWIDGVGCYRLIGSDRVSIGSHTQNDDGADIRLLAPLSRRHASIARGAEAYWLQTDAAGAAPAAGEGRLLRSGDPFEIGGGVRLRLRTPNSLSNTAVVDFISSHRPVQRIDGVILLEQVCVLGPSADAHIHCPQWSSAVMLFRRGDELWFKGTGLKRNGEPVDGEAALTNGAVLTGDELRLRVELSCD
jgi:hypothetical protein